MKTQSLSGKILLIVITVCYFNIGTVKAQQEQIKKVLPVFSSLTLNGPFDITIQQSSESSITVREGNIDDQVSAEVKDGNLVVRKGKKTPSEVIVSVVEINKIEILASGKIINSDTLKSNKLEIYIKGSASDVNLCVKTDELYTNISGAGDVTLIGNAGTHKIYIKGAGDVSAFNLATDSTNIEIFGAGDAKVNVKNKLTGTINGAGDIKYLKEPLKKEVIINGIGSCSLEGEDKEASDTLRFKFGKKKFVLVEGDDRENQKKEKDKFPPINWSGLGLGINGYLNSDNKTTPPPGYDFLELDYRKSINVQLNVWEERIPIIKKNLSIVTGAGFDISNYRFEKNYRLNPDSSFIYATLDTVFNLKKKKLVTTYFQVPLLLQFNSPSKDIKKTFHLSAGIVGSIRIGSHTKYVYSDGNSQQKPKTRSDFNLAPFRYSSMVRLGYGKLDIYASYALNGLFKKDAGPNLYPFTIGINLAGF